MDSVAPSSPPTSPPPSSSGFYEASLENPAEQVKQQMLEVKQGILGQKAGLLEWEEKEAEKIAALSGIPMLKAYEAWRSSIAEEEVVSLRETIETVTKQRDTFRNQTNFDELTGAYSRRFFNTTFKRAMQIVDSGRGPEHNRKNETQGFSLLAIDIDHFKGINDTLGHNKGDEILQKLVKVLQRRLRDEDLVARVGGEEFMVILKTDPQNAKRIAEELRKTVEQEINRDMKDAELGEKGTISIGVASYAPEDEAMAPEALKEKADRALYHSKKTGRNKVTVYSAEMKKSSDMAKAQ